MTGSGRTIINDSVVVKVIDLAARDVAGVHALGTSGPRALGAIREVIAREESRGVTVRIEDDQVGVDVSIVAEHPVPLPRMAAEIRSAVIAAVEELVGLHVTEVNVSVTDLHLPDADAQADAQADVEHSERPVRRS
ncbi:Asp23/Gls24 family envelope stress response protein [Cryobacterium fucosi]|uniref:Asp23/Gls24 family envelope stress response protein n=1 Tax=Cryobacterium fucosi TaxID=1259157 RepID=UPI001F547A6E|nr:Asp23/Gls24 family envelope stress response protein [Cryobacterium fucosi]